MAYICYAIIMINVVALTTASLFDFVVTGYKHRLGNTI